MMCSTLPIITSATAAIRAIVGTTGSGTATSGTRRRAILAMCTARSPIRSNSLTIRSEATSIRRSPATGFCSESSSKLCSSSFSRRASMLASLLITCSARWASPSSSAAVPSETASRTRRAIVTRSSRIESSWSV